MLDYKQWLQGSSAAGCLHITSYLLLLQVDRVVTGQLGEEAGRACPHSCDGQAQTEVESNDVKTCVVWRLQVRPRGGRRGEE